MWDEPAPAGSVDSANAYRRGPVAGAEDLALMRRIDELHLKWLGPAGYAICATYRLPVPYEVGRARHRNEVLIQPQTSVPTRERWFSVNSIFIFKSLLLARLFPVSANAESVMAWISH
jgi:hypothetical protein